MDKLYSDMLSKLETSISELEIDADYSVHRIETVIHLILKCLLDLKKYVLINGFKSLEAEIYFFKF